MTVAQDAVPAKHHLALFGSHSLAELDFASSLTRDDSKS